MKNLIFHPSKRPSASTSKLPNISRGTYVSYVLVPSWMIFNSNVFLMDCFWEMCSTSFTKSISCPSGHLKPPGRFGALIKTVKYSNFVAFIARQTPTVHARMDGFYLPSEILQGRCGRGLTSLRSRQGPRLNLEGHFQKQVGWGTWLDLPSFVRCWSKSTWKWSCATRPSEVQAPPSKLCWSKKTAMVQPIRWNFDVVQWFLWLTIQWR